MEILVNGCFGGYNLSQAVADVLGADLHEVAFDWPRNQPELIAAVRAVGLENAGGFFSQLRIAEIPAEATDWDIIDYDGLERVVYVLNGRLEYA